MQRAHMREAKSVQFCSVTQLCLTLSESMDHKVGDKKSRGGSRAKAKERMWKAPTQGNYEQICVSSHERQHQRSRCKGVVRSE